MRDILFETYSLRQIFHLKRFIICKKIKITLQNTDIIPIYDIFQMTYNLNSFEKCLDISLKNHSEKFIYSMNQNISTPQKSSIFCQNCFLRV